jgi:predicted Zn-dependent protease
MVFFGGLLKQIGSEDALAMVMAHELAHLKYRHASAALGRGVAVGVILSVISADLGRNAAGGLLNQAGVVTLLSFSRDQERAADEAALQALAEEYGHLGGAFELFDLFQRQPGAKSEATATVEFLRTHPLTANRRTAIEQWAAANKISITGPQRPLPPAIAALRERAGRDAKPS